MGIKHLYGSKSFNVILLGLKDIQDQLNITMGSNFSFYCTKHGSGLEKSVISSLQGATNLDVECEKYSTVKEHEDITKSIHYMDPV